MGFWDDAEIISAYYPAQAVADGTFRAIDATLADEAGYRIPVTMTAAAYADAITWERGGGWNDETGRAWDVLNTVRAAGKAALRSPGTRYGFHVYRVPNRTASGNLATGSNARALKLEVVAQGYDASGTACLTILLPGED